jgi:hypothetical protein
MPDAAMNVAAVRRRSCPENRLSERERSPQAPSWRAEGRTDLPSLGQTEDCPTALVSAAFVFGSCVYGVLAWIYVFLYLPEVLYVIILFWLIFSGPGRYSIDGVIARQVGLIGS